MFEPLIFYTEKQAIYSKNYIWFYFYLPIELFYLKVYQHLCERTNINTHTQPGYTSLTYLVAYLVSFEIRRELPVE